MGTTPHNPLIEKRKAAAEKLNRRRRTQANFSVKLAEERSAFFDRLSVLAAGALTFSVTLLGHPSQLHAHRFFVLYAAWMLLLAALGSCLVRNYFNQGHRFYSVGSNRAESEVEVIDADSDAVTAFVGSLMYDDAAEPFDSNRELRINRENRVMWQEAWETNKRKADSHWKISEAAEKTACVTMILGFLLLIVFAVANTYLQ
jgi:hypothetical protein